MDHEWKAHIDFLKSRCEVIYVPRAEGVSTTALQYALIVTREESLDDFRSAAGLLSSVLSELSQ